jgi:hypothetical protein
MRKHLLILFISLFATCVAFAQVTTSSISGVVVDEKGQTVPGATVTAIHNPTGTNYVTSTRADGRFNLPNIRIGGPYTVKVKFLGYNEYSADNITLALGDDYKVKAKLQSTSTQLAEVKINGVQDKIINANRTGQVTTVTRAQIEALPTVTRSIYDYTKLEPTANGANFGGRNSQFNSITIDGALFNNSFGLASTLGGQTNAQPISLDAVEQIQVNISPYDVTQGRFAGTGINLVTKSGTNEFKGSAYYYFRNTNLVGQKAGPFTLAVPPPVDYHQQGFSIGGPIIKNKVFLFLSAEQERISDPATTITALRPGQSASPGNISQAPYDSLTKVQNFLQSKYNFSAGPFEAYPVLTQSDKIAAKLDININKSNTLSIKYFYLKSLRDAIPSGRGPNATTNLPMLSSYYTINNNFNSGIAELNTRFSSKLANKFTIGYQALRDFRSSHSDGTTEFGYEQFTAFNKLNTDTYQISDNLTYFAGKHQIDLGAAYELNQYENGFAPQYYGAYVFNGLKDFVNSANHANDGGPTQVYAKSYLESYSAEPDGSFPYARYHSATYSLYIQDKFQVTDQFRLTYGLRADLPTTGVNNAEKNPYVQNLTLLRDGLQPDVSAYPQTRIQLSPRLGFNWDVTGDASTQIRGGAGIFSGPPPAVYISNQASNNGVQFGQISVTSLNNPGDSHLIFQHDINANRPAAGAAAANTSYSLSTVAADFKYPKNLRTDLAIDQKIFWGMTGTVEFLFTKDINGVFMQNLTVPSTGTTYAGSDNRIHYEYNYTNPANGKPAVGNTVYPRLTSASGASLNTAANPNITSAYYLLNTSKGYTYNITAQVQKNTKYLNLTAAITHGDSRNVNDGGSTAGGQWSSRTVNGDPNENTTGYSAFYFPDRFIASFAYHREYAKYFATSVGLTLEVVTPGVNSYTYNNGNFDFAGDGVNNNLMYIPKDASDIILVPDSKTDLRTGTNTLNSPNGNPNSLVAPGTNVLYSQLSNYINQDPELYKLRGSYAERNGLVTPSSQIYNFNFTQKFFIQSGKVRNTLQFEINILNVGNLLNRNWGNFKFANQTQPLKFQGVYQNALVPTDPNIGKPMFSFPYFDNASQTPLTTTFGNGTGAGSRSQAQIGLRYIFN